MKNEVTQMKALDVHILEPRHEIQTVAARTCAEFQIAETAESEDRDV